VRWTRRHAADFGADPARIAALGASAGGHLAALLGTDPADAASRVGAVIDFYGPTDLKALVASRPQTIVPVGLLLAGSPTGVPALDDAASPLRHVSPGDPPTLVVHGTDDDLIPLEQSRSFHEALRAAGVSSRLLVVDSARHGFDLRIDDRRDLLPEILAFLRNVWNPSAG
jgi:acetyl esterase/lipase